MDSAKSVHSLVLDAGPIIKNEPVVSTLINQAESLFTVPAIISEIKDASARTRVATTLQPFLTIRAPSPKSVKIITDFARRTGDLAVLSRPDIEIIALTYELECERNHGDWRLRSTPGQKRLNGAAPAKTVASQDADQTGQQDLSTVEVAKGTGTESGERSVTTLSSQRNDANARETASMQEQPDLGPKSANVASEVTVRSDEMYSSAPGLGHTSPTDALTTALDDLEVQEENNSDSDGWITPSNLKRRQAEDLAASSVETPERAVMQAAVLTTDFAMQNVVLQMNLNLLSSALKRVKHLKTFVLRCHACFHTTKDMSKQFCPRCGGPTLTRVACSTNANGEFKLHLKKNMQWNTRGDRFSVPKPVHGSANGRIKGGGKGGWGHDLILAEDQKEYERARVVEKKQKERSLMDEDYLPSILTGDRTRSGAKIKVGAGRSVNSRKR